MDDLRAAMPSETNRPGSFLGEGACVSVLLWGGVVAGLCCLGEGWCVRGRVAAPWR